MHILQSNLERKKNTKLQAGKPKIKVLTLLKQFPFLFPPLALPHRFCFLWSEKIKRKKNFASQKQSVEKSLCKFFLFALVFSFVFQSPFFYLFQVKYIVFFYDQWTSCLSDLMLYRATACSTGERAASTSGVRLAVSCLWRANDFAKSVSVFTFSSPPMASSSSSKGVCSPSFLSLQQQQQHFLKLAPILFCLINMWEKRSRKFTE